MIKTKFRELINVNNIFMMEERTILSNEMSQKQGFSQSFFGKLLDPDRRRTTFTVTFLVIALGMLVWAFAVRTSGEVADLHLSPATTSTVVGSPFNIDMTLDTQGNNVVAVKAVVQYNPANFSLVSIDTSSSVFGQGNTCVYNSKPCEIITQDASNGTAIITLAKPTPGVNTSTGLLGTIQFKALQPIVNPTAANITIQYVTFGSYADSDVILDDGNGTDILNSVTNTTVSAALEVPSGLSGTGASAIAADISWTAASAESTIVSYKVYRDGSQVGTSTTPNYQDTGLVPLTAYAYRVSGVDGAGRESVQSSSVSVTTLADTTAPSVPSNVTATGSAMDKVDVSWTAATDDVGVTGYKVYRNGSQIADVTSGTSYQDTGLTPSTTYAYTVLAYDAAGNSSAQSGSVNATTQTDSEAPTVPIGLSGTAVSISQVNLSWTAATDNVGVTGYKVYRCVGAGCSNFTQIGTPTNNSYNDTGLTVSTTYRYQVSAMDAEGNESSHSSTVNVTTNSDTTAPSVPTGLTATPASMTQIDLLWIASTDNVGIVGYRIFRDGVQVGTSSATNYSDTGLAKSTTYAYTVLAYDAAGNPSAQTAPVSATTFSDTSAPSVPTGLVGNAVSMTEIDLTWSASTDNIGVTGYRVFRNGTQIANVTSGTSYNDTGLTQNTSYSYTVLAYDADGNTSAQTAPVSVTTQKRTYSIVDFTQLVNEWLQTVSGSSVDIDQNDVVDTRDLGIMMSNWQ